MSDFAFVPLVNSEADVFTNGLTIASKDGLGDYKIGYVSSTPYTMKVGLYLSNMNLYFVFVTSVSVSDIDIYLVSPASTTLFDVTSVISNFEGGYYSEDSYNLVPNNTPCTVFASRQEALSAMGIPTPDVESGVVVTVLASPVDTPVTTDGVIVTVVGKLIDPNQQGGDSQPGGGQGTFDNSSDVIPIPDLPQLSAADTGLLTIFKPTLSELHDLGNYLWTNLTDFIENIQKMFSNPMDYFIAFHIVPCSPATGSARTVKLGLWDTNITMSPVLSQWYEHNCGYISIPEYWGNYLDYAPNTKASLFLPFIGTVTLNVDEIMNQRVGLVYRIDLLSGQCVAMLTVPGIQGQTGSVMYQFTGECSVSVPLTGADWSRIYSAAMGAVGTAITGGIGAAAAGTASSGVMSAIAGAQAADAVGNIGLAYSMINDTSKGVKGVAAMRSSMQDAANMAISTGRQAAASPSRVSNGIRTMRIANTIENTASAVMGAKHQVSHSGSISGSAGMLGAKTPYVLLEFPQQSLADNYRHFVGYPSNIYSRLGDLTGYTECEQVLPVGLSGATDSEMAELIESLKGGVYL